MDGSWKLMVPRKWAARRKVNGLQPKWTVIWAQVDGHGQLWTVLGQIGQSKVLNLVVQNDQTSKIHLEFVFWEFSLLQIMS